MRPSHVRGRGFSCRLPGRPRQFTAPYHGEAPPPRPFRWLISAYLVARTDLISPQLVFRGDKRRRNKKNYPVADRSRKRTSHSRCREYSNMQRDGVGVHFSSRPGCPAPLLVVARFDRAD